MINKVIVQYGAGASYSLSLALRTIQGGTPVLTSEPGGKAELTYDIPTGGQGTFVLSTQPAAISELLFELNLGGNCVFSNVIFSASTEGALSYSLHSPATKGLPGVNVVQKDDHFAIEVGAYINTVNPSSWV